MTREKWDGRFPFDPKTGGLLSYDGGYRMGSGNDYKTKDEARFTGELTYKGYTRGRSSALLMFTDGARAYPFFMTRADDVIPLLKYGVIKGTFVPVKTGQNFSWMLEIV